MRGCRRSSSGPTISRRAPSLLRGAATLVRRWQARCSRSATHSLRGSAGRYGLPHGALNALACRRRFASTSRVAPEAIERFGAALGAGDPAGRVEELARLGGFERLRDLGVPGGRPCRRSREAVVERPGAKANPRPVTAADVERLLRSIW